MENLGVDGYLPTLLGSIQAVNLLVFKGRTWRERKQRAEGRGQRAESREQRAEGG